MQRAMNVCRRISIMICAFLLIAACYIIAVKCNVISHVVFRLPKIAIDDRTAPLSTSTNFRYESKFQDTLKKYRNLNKLYRNEISTAIPGLERTEINGTLTSQMVPQGICVAGDYMLVTAYENVKKAGGRKDHSVKPSVIHVLSNKDPENRTYLTTIVLPDVNHVGGITFDGKRVWIAKSTTKKCSAIDYRIIEEAVASGENSYKLDAYTTEADCNVTASFITYYDNKLWVGTFNARINGKGSLQSYEMKEDGEKLELVMKERISIPAFANGVAFMEVENRICMAVVSSCGRYMDSKIFLYDVQKTKAGYQYISQGVFTFPPMAEEMVCDGENTYFLFESAATPYSTPAYSKCSYPVDRICGVKTNELFYWARNIRIENVKPNGEVSRIQMAFDCAYIDSEKYRRLLATLGRTGNAVG